MQKKYQVFVSSTFRDLLKERQDAIRSILDLGHIPAGMELFPSADTEQLSYIKKVIDECDYYVLIVGGRYGSLDEEGVSYTEREYDYAVETGKVVLAFVHGDASIIPVGKSDTAPKLVQSLNEFRDKVMAGRLVRQWTSRENLEPMVIKALVHAFSEYPATGWVRGDAVASEELLTQINELRIDNERLKGEAKQLRSSVTPKVENLAGLDEEVSLKFTYSKSYGSGRSTTETTSFDFRWAEVFAAIGPTYMAPHTPTAIWTSLSTYLIEKRGKSATYKLQTNDLEMVKLHFVALGFLNSYNAQAINAGVTEFLQLTDLGRTRLTELLAVRSKSGSVTT